MLNKKCNTIIKIILVLAIILISLMIIYIVHIFFKKRPPILIIKSPIDAKIFAVKFDSDSIYVNEILHDIDSIIINSSGKSVYSYRPDKGKSGIWFMDLKIGPRSIKSLELSNYQIELKGDLSSNGKKFCYKRFDGQKDIIEILDIYNGQIEGVIDIKGQFSLSPPRWSPDGMSIAYYIGDANSTTDDGYHIGVSEYHNGVWQHRIIAPPSKLSRRSPMRTRAPLWASNGRIIVFEARYRDEEQGPSTYIVNKDGTGLTRLVDTYYEPSIIHESGYILYSSPKKGVFIFDTDMKREKIIFNKEDVFYPKMSQDGKSIAYSDKKGAIYIISPEGLNPKEVMDTGKELPLPNMDFIWIE